MEEDFYPKGYACSSGVVGKGDVDDVLRSRTCRCLYRRCGDSKRKPILGILYVLTPMMRMKDSATISTC